MNEQMKMKNNIKIYPIYKMFAWDLLFHFAIVFLFLTQVKGFSASQVLLADSLYALFRVVFQIYCVRIVDYIGKQKGLLLGNFFVSVSIIILILCKNFLSLLLFNLIEAIGFNLKQSCEPSILSDSVSSLPNSSSTFSKIEGKGNALYYIFGAISSVVTGFLYVINPYIPMILCFTCCLISTFISLSFNDITDTIKNSSKTRVITYYKDIFSIFKSIRNSNRLKLLLIFSMFLTGILGVFITLRSSILVEINMPNQYFGLIFAFMQIASAISSKHANMIQKTFKNRTFTWLSLSLVTSFIFTGLFVICNISFVSSVVCIMIMILIGGIVRGAYYTLLPRYLSSFTNEDVNTKIFAIKNILENLGKVLIGLLASFLLGITVTSYAFVIIGCLLFIILILLLDTMKSKVGLKPEEYPEEDLVFATEDDLNNIYKNKKNKIKNKN